MVTYLTIFSGADLLHVGGPAQHTLKERHQEELVSAELGQVGHDVLAARVVDGQLLEVVRLQVPVADQETLDERSVGQQLWKSSALV